ncbi:transmembrane protein 248 [Toxotes jaculatrix]|uniref:transmembrane protein 248 n=1 Tax=Toxotes jaculatrix TaxID=941984 RepID=UPI001B3B191B|nr:transmembrane protein 248 [Toxotes jaculatrix]XP_040897321.1 transmembrane protein 248 [Toxotes jaculatrix]
MWSLKMGFWHPVSNLRDYVAQNPPGVTFFLCLLSLAISFICLSSYSYTHTLPNPDTEKDWNHLLSSLSEFQLCMKANANSSDLVSPVPSPLMEQEKDREISVNTTRTSSSSVTHLHLKVPLTVSASSASGSVTDLGLHTTLTASQLDLGGNETINVTLEFLSGNSTHTCLTISAPTHLLPMRLLPPECPATDKNTSSIHVEARNQLPTASQTCYSLHSKNDPTLTVMLTQEEQSVAVRHLLEVSVFLLGVCLILCLTASLTHSLTRRYHWNGLDLQNDPLIDT